MSHKTSSDEQNRLRTLHGYRIVDTEPEQIFDDLVGLAAAVCGTPMAVISFIDEQRQWFKASRGLGVSETPRNIAFCSHMIEACAPMVVKDARDDPRFSRNPLVTDEPNIRFYAGVPLVAEDGTCLGSVAVLDHQAASLDDSRLKALQSIAGLVMRQLEHRLVRLDLEESVREQRALMTALSRRERELGRSQQLLEIAGRVARLGGWQVDLERRRVSWSDEVAAIHEEPPGFSPELDAAFGYYAPEYRERIQQAFEACARDGRPFDEELQILTSGGRRVWVRAIGEPVQVSDGSVIAVQGGFQDISDRRQAKQEAAESAERMRGVLDSASEAIITVNEAGLIGSVNPATRRLFGYEPAELIGRNISVLMPQDHAGQHDDYVRRYVETGRARILGVRQKLRARRKDGSEFPIELTVTESVLSGTRVFTGFIKDITLEEQALEVLRTSEERFRAVARATTDVVWDYDLVANQVWWSDGLEATFGHSVAEAGQSLDWWLERVHPDDREQVAQSLEEAIDRKQPEWSVRYRFRRKDGDFAFVVDSGFLILDEYGEPRRMVGGINDITESRAARQKLSEQAELLDQARDAIIVRDLEHRVSYWNRGAERVYGWSAEEALGRSVSELLAPDPERYQAAFREVLSEGRYDGQWKHRRKDGSEITVRSHWVLVTDEKGNPRSVMAINTDISDQLELEEQLRQAQRLESIGQLTGGVAHDFNNLLTVILGNAELLSQQLESSPRLRHLAEMTQAAAQRGAELTNRLLAFARRQALEPESTDIAGLVDGMKPLLRRSIPENIEIRIRHAENLWRAEIDPARLESALLNLALNARDAMAEGGRLLIETSNIELDEGYAEFQAEILPGDYVQVAVTDTGHGIAKEHLDRLFEPFFTTKEKGKGTGLGLAMVYGFVKQSSGHVKVYSEPGEGTTVRMYLPRSRRTGEPPARATEEETELRGSERILVVEDDELVREHAERLLRHFGYEVEGAASGDEALELLERRPDFDLLFTDVIMPGALNGPALAQAALSRKPELKVLFTSGYTEDAIVHQGRLEEGVLLLQKPYRRLDLARKVREALDGA